MDRVHSIGLDKGNNFSTTGEWFLNNGQVKSARCLNKCDLNRAKGMSNLNGDPDMREDPLNCGVDYYLATPWYANTDTGTTIVLTKLKSGWLVTMGGGSANYGFRVVVDLNNSVVWENGYWNVSNI